MQTAQEVFDELVEHTKTVGSVVITRSNAAPTGDVVVFSFPKTVSINNAPSALKSSRAANRAVAMRDAMKLEMKTQRIELNGRLHFLLKFRIYDYEKVFNKIKCNNNLMYDTAENEAKGFLIWFTKENRCGKWGMPVNAVFQYKETDDEELRFECAIQHDGAVDTKGITLWFEPNEAFDRIPLLIRRLLYAANFDNEDFFRENPRRQMRRIESLEDDARLLRARLREYEHERASDSDGPAAAAAGDTSDSD